MIGVDTNVVLRRLLQDDPAQAARADQLFNQRGPILITDVVLVETTWTLTGKKYQATRRDIADAVMALIKEPNVQFEDIQAIWVAYNNFVNVKAVGQNKQAGFADALTAAKGAAVANSMGIAFGGTYSFDQGAQSLPDVHPA
jgi:predicted nucleic-acid-binding protein